MPSNRQYFALQQHPGQAICYVCLAKLAENLPEQCDMVVADECSRYRHGAGTCSICGQFAPIVQFVPEEHKKKAAGAPP
jgi:hypothetical protein